MRARRAAVFWAILLPVGALAVDAKQPRAPAPAAVKRSPSPSPDPLLSPLCGGEYADFLTSMNRETRAFEASADAGYTYCIRATATYEHVACTPRVVPVPDL